jgi:ureidoglycolate hydrolase
MHYFHACVLVFLEKLTVNLNSFGSACAFSLQFFYCIQIKIKVLENFSCQTLEFLPIDLPAFLLIVTSKTMPKCRHLCRLRRPDSNGRSSEILVKHVLQW